MDAITDLTNVIDEIEQMPLCPLCDQPLEHWMEIDMFTAHGMKAAAHSDCINNHNNE